MLLNIEEQSCSSPTQETIMSTRKSMFALAALAATAASVVASPALAGRNITGAHSVGHINVAVGRFSPTPPPPSHLQPLVIVQRGIPMPNCPGGCFKKNVGEGDTIDGIPWGGHPGNGYQPGDGTWGTVNNNLPGKGPYGN
jgi:hypothetical protein